MVDSYLDSVHLHPLTFALAALDNLSSVELALVQFHLDNDEPGFAQVLTNARRIWEERRSQAVQRGELLEGQQTRPPSSLYTASNGLAARLGPSSSPQPVPDDFFPLVETQRRLQQRPGAPVMAASLGSTMCGAFREAKVVSPLAIPSALQSPDRAPLADRLPDRIASSLFNLDLPGLSPRIVGSVAGLIGLLPPGIPCIAAGFFDPAAPFDSLRACLAFRTAAVADEAAAHLASLSAQANGLRIVASRSSDQPEWRWRNVPSRERESLWREYRLWQDIVQGKKRSESSAHPAGDGREKRRKSETLALNGLPQSVRASDRVPSNRLDSLYPLEITTDRPAKDLTKRAAADDAFVWRFGAVAWTDDPRTSGKGFYLLFQTRRDREALEEWLEEDAPRYWKFNAIVARVPSIDAIKQLDWRFRNFSHAWRSDNGFVLDRSDVAPTVGEFGRGGADYQSGDPDTGFFDFEFVLHDRHPPSPTPAIFRRDKSVAQEIRHAPKREHVAQDIRKLSPQHVEPAAPQQAAAPFPPSQLLAISSLRPLPSWISTVAEPFHPMIAATHAETEHAQVQPADSLQLSELPAFSSAPSAARFSPTETHSIDFLVRAVRPPLTSITLRWM
ncbi:proteophosphoglycan 5 [Rhodotorula toruloides]|uniref:Proteophosphoglycan 5 n=1 Tax=Rhodotorula toruloides TaxID=5286 RepID=A0A511KEG9_RHOTO|nr:proteophosphoglycan 5 [Rhodotorula toruloides]